MSAVINKDTGNDIKLEFSHDASGGQHFEFVITQEKEEYFISAKCTLYAKQCDIKKQKLSDKQAHKIMGSVFPESKWKVGTREIITVDGDCLTINYKDSVSVAISGNVYDQDSVEEMENLVLCDILGIDAGYSLNAKASLNGNPYAMLLRKNTTLHVGDKFDRIVDVMNNCFGWNYKACFRGWYLVNEKDHVSAWFPKMASLVDGVPQAGDKWHNWCNILNDTGERIYMNNLEDPEAVKEKTIQNYMELHITFAKFPGDQCYTYIGVFVPIGFDPVLGRIYQRIAEDIDTATFVRDPFKELRNIGGMDIE